MKAVHPFVWSQVLLKSRSRIKVILAIFKAYSASTTRLLASPVFGYHWCHLRAPLPQKEVC